MAKNDHLFQNKFIRSMEKNPSWQKITIFFRYTRQIPTVFYALLTCGMQAPYARQHWTFSL